MVEDEKLDALLMRFSQPMTISDGYNSMEQMGILYVGTYAAKNGYKVRVLDQSGFKIGFVEKIIASSSPKVVGFYVDHSNMHATMGLIDELKTRNNNLLCVIGGPQGSVQPWDEEILRRSKCDIVVRGEGEHAFTDILNWFVKGKGSLIDINGLTYREGNKIKKTPDRQPFRDLDILPFPDRNLNHNKKAPQGVEFLVTSRGCPYRCAFCYEGRQDASYRARSVSNVLSEVEDLLKMRHPAYIGIHDDTFTVNPERVSEFCSGMKSLREKYYDFRWFCEARANVIARHPEMMQEAVDAGLLRVQIGVETGNQHILDAYRKDLSINDIREAVRICSEADVLSIVGNFIIGGAFESWETINKSIAFAEELLDIGKGRLDVSTTIYTPYPGTPMYESPEDFGMEVVDSNCETGPTDHYAFVRTKYLSKEEILHARQKFVEAIAKKMMDSIWALPDDLLRRHFEAFYYYGIGTMWRTVASQIFHYNNYFNMPIISDYKYLKSIPLDEVDKHKPVRTVFLGASHEGKVLLDLMGKKVELNDVASFIFEHCYGKLTNEALVDRVWQNFYPDSERQDVRALVLKFLENLDKEKLCVFARL